MSVAGVGPIIDQLVDELRELCGAGSDMATLRQKCVYILEAYADDEGLEAARLAADAFSAAARLTPGPMGYQAVMRMLFDLDGKFGHVAANGVGDPRDWPPRHWP